MTKLWLVEVTKRATVYVTAETKDEALGVARDDGDDILDDGDSDFYARRVESVTGSAAKATIWNDERRVGGFLAGEPSDEEQAEAKLAAWKAGKPDVGPVERALWLADMPADEWGAGVGSVGSVVFGGWAVLRVHGCELPYRDFRGVTLDKIEKILTPSADHRVVRAGPDASMGDQGRTITGPTFGPASVDREKIEEWLPGPWTEALAAGPLDAVHFRGDGWDAVIMPFRRD